MGPLSPQVFNAAQGEVVSVVAPNGAAVVAVQVERINRLIPAEHPQVVEAARVQALQGLQETMVEAIEGQVVERMHPRRNTRLIDSTYRRSTDQDNEAGS
jgi:hypothetical protein